MVGMGQVGQLRHGFPREANSVVEIGGVRTLFRMPDLLSIGLGGGSIVERDPITVGPRSVGYRLTRQALVFGGDILTATDAAVAAGLAKIGDTGAVAGPPRDLVAAVLEEAGAKIEDSVDRIKTDAGDLPLIAVGGGAFLVPGRVAGYPRWSACRTATAPTPSARRLRKSAARPIRSIAILPAARQSR
jgi:N-methylhydantoinase A/oxoprolinase/acetone carboxylase beta subunit